MGLVSGRFRSKSWPEAVGELPLWICPLVCKMGTTVASSHGYDNAVRLCKVPAHAWPTVGLQHMPGHRKASSVTLAAGAVAGMIHAG